MNLNRMLLRAASVGMVGTLAAATPAYASEGLPGFAGVSAYFEGQSAGAQGVAGVAAVDYTNEAYANAIRILADSSVQYEMTEEETADQVALAESVDEVAEEQEKESPYADVAISQVRSYVNVREDASENSEPVGRIYNNAAATIVDTVETENEGTWYHITSGSVDGYVKSNYFATGDEAEKIAYEVGDVRATVTAETLRLRSEASTDSSCVTLLSEDEKYEVIQQDGDFTELKIDDDVTGYVSTDYVNIDVIFDHAMSNEEIQAAEEAKAAAEAEKAAAEEAAAAEAAEEAAAAEEDSEEEDSEDENSEEEDTEDEDSEEEDTEDEDSEDEDSEDEDSEDEDSEDEDSEDEDSEDEDSEDEDSEDEDSEDEDSEDEDSEDEDSEDEENSEEEVSEDNSDEENSEEEEVTEDEEEEEEEEDSSSSVSGTRQDIVDYAVSMVGNVRYVWGGTSLSTGVDCSGFVQQVFKHFGISLPRTSASQGSSGSSVSSSSMQPGDLVYYGGHIAIYIGNGKVVHASNAKSGVKISTWNYRSYISIRNVID